MKTSRRTTAALLVINPVLFLALFLPSAQASTRKGSYIAYVGTYTDHASKGIYAFRYDSATGRSTSLGLVAETTNPSFLAVDPSQRFLYAVNEVSDYQGQKSGGVSAFSIDRKTGKLTFLNEVSSRGAGPCHLTLDKTGKYLLVANYDAGNLAVFPVLQDGRLGDASSVIQHTGHGPNDERQEGPHAHEVQLSRDNRFALAADLGLDKVLVYKFDSTNGTLSPNTRPAAEVEPGAGPRHFVFHPGGKLIYVINEMQSTVTGFTWDAGTGGMSRLRTVSTLPKDFTGHNDTAEIETSLKGKILYGSNRGHDSIAVFSVNSGDGALKLLKTVPTRGKTPRNFAIDPTGAFLFAANQESNKLVVFRINSKSGDLTPTGEVLEVPAPVCVKFVAVD